MRKFRAGLLLIIASLALSAVLSCKAAEDQSNTSAIYQQLCRSTAVVRQNSTRGTGFLVDRSRKWLVTNYHVIAGVAEGKEPVGVTFPDYDGGSPVAEQTYYKRYDRPIRGWVIASDLKRDLAVIELDIVPHAARAVKLAEDSSIPGERVHLVGNPGRSKLFWEYNTGLVWRVSSKKWRYPNYKAEIEAIRIDIKTKSPTGHGYSGCPVVNDRGELVAVVSGANLGSDGLVALGLDVSEVRDLLAMSRDPSKMALRRTISRYNEILEHDRKNADAYRRRGAAYARQCIYDPAIADFTEALRLDPKSALTHYNRGLAYAQRGTLDHAIALVAATDIYHQLNALFCSPLDQAIADFTAAVEIDPQQKLAYFDRATAHLSKRSLDRALADYSEAIGIDPKDGGAYQARAGVYLLKGLPDEAIADFTKALQLNPENAQAYTARAEVYGRKRARD